ncbi:MAG: Npt1/Npt2 family nucleotide transporter [Halioglobus sp.]
MQGFTPTERFLSLFTTLRQGEGRGALLLCLQSFSLLFSYYLMKVIREPMILADGSAELKSYSTAMQAVLLMLIVPAFARLYQRISHRDEKHPIYRNTLMFFVVNLLLFAAAYQMGWRVGIVFYVWLGIFSVMVLSLFWAFATDLYNLKSGQRIFPLIAAASALGALAGSGFASWLDMRIGHHGIMLLSAALLLLPWWISASTEQNIPAGSSAVVYKAEEENPYPILEGFHIVWRSRYLTLIACFVIVLNLINTNGEYILATFVTQGADAVAQEGASAKSDFITEFYSSYLFLTTMISFLIQLFLVSRIYDRIGIRGALYVLPILMLANYSFIALVPVLAVIRYTMVAENSINYSLQTTTRHALFLPVAREEKYVGKHTIDTFFFRVGDVLSGGFVYVISAIIGLGIISFVTANIVLALILLLLSRAIGFHHRNICAENQANLPPVANKPLDDIVIPSGQLTHLVIDVDTFVDPDEGDALKYLAFAVHLDRLPPWVKFDGLQRQFQFQPPAKSSGDLAIRVVARDFDGLEAEVFFTVSYGRE